VDWQASAGPDAINDAASAIIALLHQAERFVEEQGLLVGWRVLKFIAPTHDKEL
jgi:hypothetical protein